MLASVGSLRIATCSRLVLLANHVRPPAGISVDTGTTISSSPWFNNNAWPAPRRAVPEGGQTLRYLLFLFPWFV